MFTALAFLSPVTAAFPSILPHHLPQPPPHPHCFFLASRETTATHPSYCTWEIDHCSEQGDRTFESYSQRRGARGTTYCWGGVHVGLDREAPEDGRAPVSFSPPLSRCFIYWNNSWVLKVFYLNRVLSKQARARLLWFEWTKPMWHITVMWELKRKNHTFFLHSSVNVLVVEVVLVFYSLCAVIYKGPWEGVFAFSPCFVLVEGRLAQGIYPGTKCLYWLQEEEETKLFPRCLKIKNSDVQTFKRSEFC